MTDPTILGISRLAYEFSDSEKFIGFLEAFLAEYTTLQISGLKLLNERYLNTAIGVQLDGIGEIVGLVRPSEVVDEVGAFGFRTDPTALGFGTLLDSSIGGNFADGRSTGQKIGDDLYRLLIRAKIIENQIAMTVDETLELISFTFSGISVRYILGASLFPTYEIYKILTPFEANLVSDFPVLIGLAGVNYNFVNPDEAFGFDDDDDAFGFADIAEPSTDLIGYWPFNDGSGLVAQDVSGNDNDGVLSNMGATPWQEGKVGKCLRFYNEASTEWVRVINDPIFQMGLNSFYLSFWMNFENITSPNEHWILQCGGVDYYRLSLYNFSTSLVKLFSYISDGSNSKNGSGGTNLFGFHDIWFHVVVVWDRVLFEKRHYINSVLDWTNDMSSVTGTVDPINDFRFGENFNGKLDEMRLYTGVPTQTEIDFLYNFPTGTKGGYFASRIT